MTSDTSKEQQQQQITTTVTGATVQGPKNHVRISLSKNKFTYVDLTKYLLHEGEQCVELSGMGDAIANVVEIAEILKSQGTIEVKEIETCRAPEKPNGIHVDRIRIKVVKTPQFERIFAQQQKEKEARREEKEKEASS
jgi:hypothetical protein